MAVQIKLICFSDDFRTPPPIKGAECLLITEDQVICHGVRKAGHPTQSRVIELKEELFLKELAGSQMILLLCHNQHPFMKRLMPWVNRYLHETADQVVGCAVSWIITQREFGASLMQLRELCSELDLFCLPQGVAKAITITRNLIEGLVVSADSEELIDEYLSELMNQGPASDGLGISRGPNRYKNAITQATARFRGDSGCRKLFVTIRSSEPVSPFESAAIGERIERELEPADPTTLIRVVQDHSLAEESVQLQVLARYMADRPVEGRWDPATLEKKQRAQSKHFSLQLED